MNIAEITAKARVLLEALPYIQDFRGSIFVVKYGGSFMDDPDPVVRTRIAFDLAFLAACGINVVVVHGGGKAITKAMEASGLKANFVNGLRVTDEATIAVVKKTLDEIVNKDVCAAITTAKGKPMGLPGDTVLVCEAQGGRRRQPDRPGLRRRCHRGEGEAHQEGNRRGLHPRDFPGGRRAGQQALQRERRRGCGPGRQCAPGTPAGLHERRPRPARPIRRIRSRSISTLKTTQVEELKKKGVIDKGMRPKVASAVRALQEGVQRVHFVDGRLPHSLLLEIFTDQGIGTEIVHG
jgi:acetylglutamate kinase